MAKQRGITVRGTINNMTFYSVKGKGYVRLKSSLDAKRVKKDPAFAGLMKCAGILASASSLASTIYRELKIKNRKLYQEMTGKAILLIKDTGLTTEETFEVLKKEYDIIRERLCKR